MSGFTLIELVVVMAVLAFALALIVGYKPPWSSRLGLHGTAAELASSLRVARSEAILSNRPVALKIDVPGHRYQIGAGAIRALPPRLAVSLLTIVGERYGSVGDIRFNPDGSSTGGRIVIADGAQKIVVGVDWLNGRIKVADGH